MNLHHCTTAPLHHCAPRLQGARAGRSTDKIFQAKGSIPLGPIGFYVAIVNTGRTGGAPVAVASIGSVWALSVRERLSGSAIPDSRNFLERPPWNSPSLSGSKLDHWSF